MKLTTIIERIFLLNNAAKILSKINRLSDKHKKTILLNLESCLVNALQNPDIALDENLHLAVQIGFQSLRVLKLIKDNNTDIQKSKDLIDSIISKSLGYKIG